MAGESKAEFVVDETLRGEPFTVVGATGDVAGEIVLNGEDLARSRVAAVRVNARTLKTDSDRRDGAIGRMILRSGDPANEFITFSPTRLEGLPKTAEPDKEFSFTIVGDLTIAGETRQASFAAAARLVPDGALVASAKTVINYKDFGLTIPKVPFVAWVSDDVALKINLVAKKTE
jgi:polyisoprenoid-binding protein YceI